MTHQNDQTKLINYCHSLMNYSLCISLSYSFFISIISPSKPEGYTAMCEQSPSFVFSLYIHEIQMNVFQKVYFCLTFFCHHLQVPSPPQPVEEISSSTDLISINLSGRKFFILLRNFARCFLCSSYSLSTCIIYRRILRFPHSRLGLMVRFVCL